MNTFIQDIKENKAKILDFDTYIQNWENSNVNTTLEEYLGITFQDLQNIFKFPSTTQDILRTYLD